MRFLWLIGLTFPLLACDAREPEQLLRIHGATMGTTYNIAWVGKDPAVAETLKTQADERLRAINRSMSTYDPESELSLLNQGRLVADPDGWIPLSADLVQVLSMSLQIWRASEGAFDVTVGPLVNLWGFGPQARPEKVPEAELIARTRAEIGSAAIELDEEKRRVRLHKPLYIDLSAIAKGWAVDELGRLLEQQGIDHYMAEIGGEILTRGHKPGAQPWRIAIERPQLSTTGRQPALVLAPGNNGLATSGDYRNYFEEAGVRYSHTINPATGYPVGHRLASVSVIHESVGMADGWATALTVLGDKEGMLYAERYGLAVMMIVREGDGFVQTTSARFNELFPQAAE